MEMTINGVTLQADFMDADFMEIFEPAINQVQEEIQSMRGKTHECVAAGYLEINGYVEKFFNTVWGPDTSDLIFAGSKNVKVHLEALGEITEVQKREKKAFNDLNNKYMQRQTNGMKSMQGHQKKQQRPYNPT